MVLSGLFQCPCAATMLEAALEAVPEQGLGGGVVVPLLNGVDHVARLRDRYGHERVLPGTIRVEAERLEPGRVCQLSPFANVEVAPQPHDANAGGATVR